MTEPCLPRLYSGVLSSVLLKTYRQTTSFYSVRAGFECRPDHLMHQLWLRVEVPSVSTNSGCTSSSYAHESIFLILTNSLLTTILYLYLMLRRACFIHFLLSLDPKRRTFQIESPKDGDSKNLRNTVSQQKDCAAMKAWNHLLSCSVHYFHSTRPCFVELQFLWKVHFMPEPECLSGSVRVWLSGWFGERGAENGVRAVYWTRVPRFFRRG